MNIHRLILTGGHPTPALAVIDELASSYPHMQVTFVGRRYMNAHEPHDSYEYAEINRRAIPFINLEVLRGWKGLVTLPMGLWRSMQILRTVQPDALLSFGGYIALPMACAAWLMRIPVYTHEQTAVTGNANRFIGLLARRVFVSFPQQATGARTIYTGNPVRAEVVNPHRVEEYAHLSHPVLVVNGGNLGSHSLNVHVFAILEQLLQTFTVIHQTGNIVEYGDYEKAQKIRERLSPPLQTRYIPVTHLKTDVWGYVLSQTDIMVGRSGANNFIEAIATQTPCVSVPLPWSARNEQQIHADILHRAGVAEIFLQHEPSSVLLRLITQVYTNRSQYKDKYRTLVRLYVPQAAHHIVQAIIES